MICTLGYSVIRVKYSQHTLGEPPCQSQLNPSLLYTEKCPLFCFQTIFYNRNLTIGKSSIYFATIVRMEI